MKEGRREDCWALGLTPVTPALRKLSQENYRKLEVSLVYLSKPCLQKTTVKQNNNKTPRADEVLPAKPDNPKLIPRNHIVK